jgi:voltage-gated potassium channel Kch
MTVIGIQDCSVIVIYITALYWAVTTIMTVGYGDILPVTVYEKLLICIILVLGVAIFSFFLSSMAN